MDRFSIPKRVASPQASEQLVALYRYIAAAAGPVVAIRYTDASVAYCESPGVFPGRGRLRDDVRPGLRLTHDRKRAMIAFAVDGDVVGILGVFHGGQDDEARLLDGDAE